MTAPVESDFVYLFAGMLALGAVLLAFLPIFRHMWFYSVSRTVFAIVLAAALALAAIAAILVRVAEADPTYFLPVIGVTVALRLMSPSLLYLGIRDRFDAAHGWELSRWLLALAFVALMAILVYDAAILASGGQPAGIATVSEQLVMAVSASSLIVRAALRGRPRVATEWWPVWLSALLLALAFVVVLPYAVPAFALVYAASGFVGWLIGAAVLIRDL